MPDNKDNWRSGGAGAPPPAPPAINSAALMRVIGLVRGFTGFAGVVTVVVLVAEAKLPPSYKPSTLIGSFHGHIEAADALAKIGPVTELTRRNAEAAAQPPAFATMEADAFRQQQQILSESLQAQTNLANIGDATCLAGQLIPRDNRNFSWIGELLRGTCGISDELRQNIVTTLKRGGQDNSVLIQRPRAGAEGR